MKVTIEIDEQLSEECVVIKCKELNENVIALQKALMEQADGNMTILLHKGDKEYYMPLDEILFFETENKLIRAHTRDEIYETDYKLYELEELLLGHFMRISKSTIVDLTHILSITKNLAASSLIEFVGSHKKVYVSRNYYKAMVERLAEKRRKI